MKELSRDIISTIVKKAGVIDEKINKIIGTLGISLARQASKAADRSIILDNSTLSEIAESLRIGADITPSEAKAIIINVESTVKIQDEAKIKLLDEGIFEVDKDTLKFKLNE